MYVHTVSILLPVHNADDKRATVLQAVIVTKSAGVIGMSRYAEILCHNVKVKPLTVISQNTRFYTEQKLIETKNKEIPPLHQCTHEMSGDEPACVVHLEVVKSDNMETIRRQALMNTDVINNEKLLDTTCIKQEPLHDDGRDELINVSDINQEILQAGRHQFMNVNVMKQENVERLMDIENNGLSVKVNIKNEPLDEVDEGDKLIKLNDIKREVEEDLGIVNNGFSVMDVQRHEFEEVSGVRNVNEIAVKQEPSEEVHCPLEIEIFMGKDVKQEGLEIAENIEGSDTNSEYESGAPGQTTKKKLRTEIVHKKCVTTYTRQDYNPSETESTDTESHRLNKAPRTSAERGREFRARKALLKQQSKQQQEPATEDIRSAEIRTIEKRVRSAEATRRWREKKQALAGHQKKQAKTAAERMREYRRRKRFAIQMEVDAYYEQQQQTEQQSQLDMEQTQTRPYSNAERQKRYREKRKADKMNACNTFSQSSEVKPQQEQQDDVQLNKPQSQYNAERLREYRKLLREQKQQRQTEHINAITVLSDKPYTFCIQQLENVDHDELARKRHLNKIRQSRFRARQRFESPSTSSQQAQAERCRSD